MRNYLRTQKLLCLRLLLLIAAYVFVRFAFLIFNLHYFQLEIGQIVIAFIAGIRFDLSAIIYTNAVFIVLHVLPGNWTSNTYVQKIQLFLFVFVNSLFLLFNIGDIKYFSFINKRSTFDLFYLAQESGDVWSLIPTFIFDYWYVVLLWVFVSVMLYKLYPGRKTDKYENRFTWKDLGFQSIGAVVLLSLFTVGARGGLQLRPINMLTAVQYLKPDKIALVTNTTFTLINSYSSDRFEPLEYYSKQEAEVLFSPEQSYRHRSQRHPRKNVVVLILESFSAEYSAFLSGNKQGFTPFLDSLMQESLCFTRGYANGKKSMEALPAIISSLPALMDNPYITSLYNSNVITSIPIILEKYKYHSYFFHGGANGTMGFDNYSKAAGIDNYMGINEYVGRKADFDGHWGVYDEPYLQYVADVLDTVSGSFFAGVFTLSSHHPYKIPERYIDSFPKGEFPILESVAYADRALRNFFTYAKKMRWYKNTLFVLTADHTAQSYTMDYSNIHGNYRIPILFFDPGNSKLKGIKDHVVQQTDIFPSVIDYLKLNDSIVSYGSSVFSRDTGWAISYLNNVYQLVTDSMLLQFDGTTMIGLYNLKNDKRLVNNLIADYQQDSISDLRFLKAIIQDFRYRLINNKLSLD
ncbi:MAG: LTA synthase family protein [Salinivirgaceae bacterium]|nr:LTA synthase family protein [Salinivirgaceae bacterium]MDD4747208.1 LTA synthase family protein [Salinivirgaceae bacterium]MDY0279245.1 LTA synthase family protein [Salinivirgaceae bacterium]